MCRAGRGNVFGWLYLVTSTMAFVKFGSRTVMPGWLWGIVAVAVFYAGPIPAELVGRGLGMIGGMAAHGLVVLAGAIIAVAAPARPKTDLYRKMGMIDSSSGGRPAP